MEGLSIRNITKNHSSFVTYTGAYGSFLYIRVDAVNGITLKEELRAAVWKWMDGDWEGICVREMCGRDGG
ncbi:hypothetical protein HQN90_03765 [Paenibacillus alba]|uniref:hypothetical protein n=1 Tax=Paenibacillus alba TaxID=1197127 RepID=UPI001565D437|nr:hypothetical protein [Paenibacillus alba]NQX65240.1 hypothetical protein [Paenibacillus alba]